MRRWIVLLLDDLVFPIVLAFLLAALGVIPFVEGALFFATAEIFCTLMRRHLPIAPIAAHLFAPLGAPVPAFTLVWSLFPNADLLVMGTMVAHYFIYLVYAGIMVFLTPFLEDLLGIEAKYDDPGLD